MTATVTRAAQGEFVRCDTSIYGRASGTETIVIDASLMPVKDDEGKVVYIAAGSITPAPSSSAKSFT